MKVTKAKQITKEFEVIYKMRYRKGKSLIMCILKNGKDIIEAVDTAIYTSNRKNAKEIFNKIVNNGVSPYHIKDVLTDLCVEYLNNR